MKKTSSESFLHRVFLNQRVVTSLVKLSVCYLHGVFPRRGRRATFRGAVLYFTGLLWSFMGIDLGNSLLELSWSNLAPEPGNATDRSGGVSSSGVGIVSDIFMGAIEKAMSTLTEPIFIQAAFV